MTAYSRDFQTYRNQDLPVIRGYDDKYDKLPIIQLKELCEKNDPVALYEMAARLRLGEGVQKNPDLARDYYEKVLDQQKHLRAMLQITWCVNSSEEKAKYLPYLELGSELGDGDCSAELGDIYWFGNMGFEDFEKAKKYYQLAIMQGHEGADSNLAALYYDAKRYAEAFPLFMTAYKRGDEDSAYGLGCMYYYGNGVAQDFNKAYAYFKYASDKGCRHANLQLGEIIGKGTLGREDMELSFRYLSNVEDTEIGVACRIKAEILYTHGDRKAAAINLIRAIKNGDEKSEEYIIEMIDE